MLIGKNILGQTFVQDPKNEWVKINGVAIGESPQFAYTTFKNNSIGNLLDQLASDDKTVVVIYEWKTGKAYVKTGFNLSSKNDQKLNPGITSFVFKARVTQNMVNNSTPQPPTPTPTPTPTPSQPTQPTPSQPTPSQPTQPTPQSKRVSPYIDVCLWPPFDMVGCAKKTGNKYFSLAFIIADSTNNPSFGGGYPLSSKWYLDQITGLRALGGDVIISFGGANGSELATVIKDINKLVSLYQSVIDLYSCKIISFDIEGSSIADMDSIDRRNKAISILQKNNPNVKINYVLPVMPYGLDHHGLALIQNAKKNNVVIYCVELMTMDYGQQNKEMGKAAISASKETKAQLNSNGYKDTNIVIIPMIGVNDTAGETFTLQNAKEVATFAKNTNYIHATSFWSINRDKLQKTNNIGPLFANSGVVQKEFEFLTTLISKEDLKKNVTKNLSFLRKFFSKN